MASTAAHVRASNKYNKKNYKKLQCNIKPDDFDKIDTFCKTSNISKASLIVQSVMYCINNNIPLTDAGADTPRAAGGDAIN